MRHLLIVFSILVFIARTEGNLRAQSLSFDHLTLEDGLSESTVLAITQDATGFMWFGTREGLNRYDARKVKVFQHDPDVPTSLSDNFIYSLLSDRRGRLWVGTRNGLNLFDPATETFRRFFSVAGSDESLSDNTITALMEDNEGRIWIATRNGLNVLVEGDSLTFSRLEHPSDDDNKGGDDIHSIFEDRDGMIWIGTSGGFSRLDFSESGISSFRSFKLPRVKGAYEKNNSVNSFEEDAYGRLLVGTERSGLIFVNKQTFEFVSGSHHAGLDSKAVRSMFADPSGNFWIGTIGGLYIANHDFTTIRNFRSIQDNAASITDNSIRSIFYDRDGSYWIGTFHGGVNIHSPLSKQFHQLAPRIGNRKTSIRVASAIATDRSSNLWVGTEGNGLFFLDPYANVKSHFRHDEANSNSLSHDNVKCLLVEEGTGIWIGTIKGLDFYDFKTKQFLRFRNNPRKNNGLPDDVIYDIVKDRNNKLWVATYFGGLARIDREKGVVENVYTHDPNNLRTLSSQTVTCLFQDSEDNLWVGTASGLNKQLPDGSFMRIPADYDASPATALYITTIFEDSGKRVWIGTRGRGFYLLNHEGKMVRHFSVDDGLPGNSVYGLHEDGKGFLWISTENGLSKFDAKAYAFKNYNRSDGLFCEEFNFNSHHQDALGNFYFGGYNGVAWFHPDSIYENKVIPTVTFTSVRLFNKPVRLNDGTGVMTTGDDGKLSFRHDQNIFSVEFAVLNFINSSKNRYAYKLDGFEDGWNYVQEPVATYMNLAPGKYVLQVMGANNDGLWNKSPATMTILVLPPSWKTWWAYTAYCVVFLLLLYGWARLNKKQITLRHELQLEHLEKVKQDELLRAKLNFFTNIAHEIRTPVTLIASPVAHLLELHTDDASLKKGLTLIKSNSDRLMRLLNQLLDFQKQETGNVILKIGNGNIVPFVRDIVESFREYAESRRVLLGFDFSTSDFHLWFDREELSKVFFNLLANALKFTPGGGQINVSIASVNHAGDTVNNSSAAPFVRIVVQDNGLGIAPGQLEKIFHRFYQAENTGIQDAGFGIGLALAKGIVDLHHGTISVESREATALEAGYTKFSILLRTGNSHFDVSQLDRESEHSFIDFPADENIFCSPDNKSSGERSLILIVEDNEEIRCYMRDMLAGAYNILESANGADGLSIAFERLPDLIISDIMMPVMDGIEMIGKLKKDVRTNHIPVILLTARGAVNHQVEGLETGADDYLTKPFNTSVLVVKVKNHLATREKLKEKYSRMVRLQPADIEIQDPDDRFLQKLMYILEANMNDSEFNVSSLAREIGMSRPVLFRKTKMLTGLSVIDLLRDVRLKRAEMLLIQRKLSISEIAFTVGFSDPKYFSRAFRNQYGKSPSQYIDEAG